MKYKLIAIDLDGTLLTDNKDVTQENISVLKKLNSLGVEIVIATGRRYWSAKKLVSVLGIDLTILANNGNIIRETIEDRVLATKYIDKEDFKTLVNEGKKKDLHPIIHVNHYEEGYDFVIEFQKDDERYTSYLPQNETRYKVVDDMMKLESDNILVVCYTGSYKELNKFQESITKTYPSRYNTHIMESTNVGAILEFMNPLGSKWLSLKEYASEKGIEIEEIIAIGDDNNDVEMIRKAGLGIAMKNSINNVKKVADIITEKTNNESGVADILIKIFNL